MDFSISFVAFPKSAAIPNKTDAGNGSNGICRVIDASRSPSPDPKRSALLQAPRMKSLLLMLLLSTTSRLAADPAAETRSVGKYSVAIAVSEKEPRTILSIILMRGKERFALPASLFDDIRTPHIGPGYKSAEFKLEVKRSRAFIRICAGDATSPDEHAWILPLPLKEARRITRDAAITGYTETRKATALTK